MPTQTAAVAKKPKRALRGKPQKPFFERLALDFKRTLPRNSSQYFLKSTSLRNIMD